MTERLGRALALIAPGMLVAATGVGAGDLATATLAGGRLGTVILWAVVVGGAFKFVLNEGLARWQLATGTTFVEGAVTHLGRAVAWIFLPYLMLWSWFVSAALMGACGIAIHAMVPLFESAETGKVVFGLVSSAVGLLVARAGGFRVFERVMGVCIGFLFLTVLLTAATLWPGTAVVLEGLLRPSIPSAGGAGVGWTVGLIGGVGGTVTILCYGYWIREHGRQGAEAMRACRIDLAVGYGMTVLFGLAMVIVGSVVKVEGTGATLLVDVADRLDQEIGAVGRWVFLCGALAAVFSSLLGVWQAVPYIFADVWRRLSARAVADPREEEPASPPSLEQASSYRTFQLALATLPGLGLLVNFASAQLAYAIAGALFLPMLAGCLLYLNAKKPLVGDLANRWRSVAGLIAVLAFFGWLAVRALVA